MKRHTRWICSCRETSHSLRCSGDLVTIYAVYEDLADEESDRKRGVGGDCPESD
jgi:hypothetical protein